MRKISLVPSVSLKTFLEEASGTYEIAMAEQVDNQTGVAEYLMTTRGLSWASVQSFRIGYVENPLPGHEKYRGMIAIPYQTASGIVSMRFRAVPSDEYAGPKYMSTPGDIPRVFNTLDLDRRELYVCVTEGEFDCISAHQAGLPAVGIPGVNGWKDWYANLFKGYATVYVLADNDDKGQGVVFAEKVAGQVANARVVVMPEGHDVNSFLVAEGPDAVKARLEGKK